MIHQLFVIGIQFVGELYGTELHGYTVRQMM